MAYNQEIIDAFQSGEIIAGICKRLSVSSVTVYRHLERAGIKPNRRAKPEIDIESAVAMYNAGHTVPQIAKRFNRSVSYVWERLVGRVTFLVQKHTAGAKHWNWKGGNIVGREIYTRTNPAYRDWRTAVLTRDKNTCQLCQNKRGKGLHAHHIKQKAKYPELAFEVSNGITLCKRCHNKLVTTREGILEHIFELAVAAGTFVPYAIFVWFNTVVLKKEGKTCECGCGQFTRFYHGKYRRFAYGHHRRGVPLNANQLAAVASNTFKPMDPAITDRVRELLGTMPQRRIADTLNISQGFVSKVALSKDR